MRRFSLCVLVCLLALPACNKDASNAANPSPSPSPSPSPIVSDTNSADGDSKEKAEDPMPDTDPSVFIESSTALAMDLYKATRSQPGNLVFSPASISVALGMTYAGAAGETAAEMREVLHLPEGGAIHKAAGSLVASWNADDQAHELRVVNRLFGESSYSFEPSFLDLTRTDYAAPLELVNFTGDPEAQRQHINQWVLEQTKDRIKDLLPPKSIDVRTRLVLTNAVYFLGSWAHAFDARQTSKQSFFVDGKTKAAHPLMQQTGSFRYAEADDLQILEMPYEGSDLAMTLFLPRTKTGLAALEEKFDAAHLTTWLQALGHPTKTEVTLPRFEIKDARLPLKDVLIKLGMKRAFDARGADFSAMAKPAERKDELYIADAFHQAFVRVDEKGTEAAAATAVVMATRGAAMPPKVFRADHPFLFAIRDTKSGAVLFLGRIVDPR